MSMIRAVVTAQVNALPDDEVEVILSTSQLARDGHIFEAQGCELQNYRANPIWLWSHDPLHPVARASEIAIVGDKIRARVIFAPAGISAKADEVRGLVKAGIIKGFSVGMEPLETEPLDPKKPRGGQLVKRWELLEASFCAVPVDTGAVVTARAMERKMAENWKVGASRNLAIEDSDDWDGPAAEASIFEHAGGDDFDPAKARQGFLVYDAAKPKLRGSYKLPIAHAVGGALKVPKGAIKSAASRLPQTDIPDEVKKRAQAVLDHYKEKAGMKDGDKNGGRSFGDFVIRMARGGGARPTFRRGLYEVAQLAFLLHQLGCTHDGATYEAALEGDGSDVPAMLGEALVALGDAFIAMAKEEATELLDDKGLPEGEDDIETRDLPESERAFIAAGKTPRIRAWRRGVALARAGKVLSTANEKRLNEADTHHDRAMKHHRALGEHNEAVGGHMDAIDATQEEAQSEQDEVGSALAEAGTEPDPEKVKKHVKRAADHHRALDGHLQDLQDHTRALRDRHQDVGDSSSMLGRSLKAAQRCVRAVLDGAVPGSDDGDSHRVQTSGGTGENSGEETRSLDYRRRQVDLLRLAQQ